MPTAAELVSNYFLRLPHIWCAGCGIGVVAQALVRAIDESGLDRDRVCLVSGIGCSGRVSNYLDFDAVKGTHGRALAFATGLKLFKPELTVIAVMGDGDCAAIGGNHLIHAARRNIDVKALVINNGTYGMTGGQSGPTTPFGDRASTAPYGTVERAFDLCRLAEVAGATYVARSTVYHVRQLQRFCLRALTHVGFAFVEAVSPCPTYRGRFAPGASPADMLRQQRAGAVAVTAARSMTAEQLEGRIVVGELVDRQEPEFVAEYLKIVHREREMDP